MLKQSLPEGGAIVLEYIVIFISEYIAINVCQLQPRSGLSGQRQIDCKFDLTMLPLIRSVSVFNLH